MGVVDYGEIGAVDYGTAYGVAECLCVLGKKLLHTFVHEVVNSWC
jgi:hypothetical protein